MPTPQDQSILAMIKATPVILPVLMFVGGLWAASLNYTRSVATVPYVDEKIIQVMRYSDTKDEIVLQKSYDHADSNKKDMMIEIKSQGADVKTLSSKIDLLLESLRTLQSQMFDTRRR